MADQRINKEDGLRYWQDIAADSNGMLGGIPTKGVFASVPRIDIQGSRTFLARLGVGVKNGRHKVLRAVDGGAGIGRITQNLLVNIAETVDVVEPVSKFTDKLKDVPGVGEIYNVGLEDWHPQDTKYDLIWTQWCVGHLTDAQLVSYLQVCKEALTDTGIMVVKENQSTSGEDIFDETDSSVTRTDEKFLTLFEKAGLRVFKADLQRGFPELPNRRLFPVKMYALKPQ